MSTARMYGVFSPLGELVAAFTDYKMADAMAAYDWDALKTAAYWSVAPQQPTIGRVQFEYEAPENRHRLKDEPLERCSAFNCSRHSPNLKAVHIPSGLLHQQPSPVPEEVQEASDLIKDVKEQS